jgi:5'-nucleotidase
MRHRSIVVSLAVALAAVPAVIGPAIAQQDPSAAPQRVTLTLLHNNDGESSLLPITYTVGDEGTELAVGGIAAFKSVTQRELADAREAGNLALNVYAGDSFLASATLACSLPPAPPETPIFDGIAQAQIPYDAHILGNHEFDYGPGFLYRFIWSFARDGALRQPFLSANLDFRPLQAFRTILARNGLIVNRARQDRVLARSAILRPRGSRERFGIVGATTWLLPSISSPGQVRVTPNLAATVRAVQREINRLMRRGVNRIIFVSHLQDVDNDQTLVGQLRGVDIAVAGGGDELLLSDSVDDASELLPGEVQEQAGTYPIIVQDADGRDVPIVTTAGNYKYLGRLDVVFGSDGEVAEILTDTSFPRRVIPEEQSGTQIEDLGIEDAVASDRPMQRTVIEPVEACLAEFAATPIARSEVVVNVARGNIDPFDLGVRSAETNGGNLVADSFIAAYDAYAETSGMPARDPEANRVIAVQNGGGIRQNAGNLLPAGGTPGEAITRLDTLNVLPFDNYLVVAENVSAEALQLILELSCQSVGGGGFLQVSGLSYTCDLAQPEGSRLMDVTFTNGTADTADDLPIVDGQTLIAQGPFRIVTNQFTAAGGDDYEVFTEQVFRRLTTANGTQIFYEQALRDYLQSLPASGDPELPTIAASDTRYAEPSGEGRITILGAGPASPAPAPPASESPAPASPGPESPAPESPAPAESVAASPDVSAEPAPSEPTGATESSPAPDPSESAAP